MPEICYTSDQILVIKASLIILMGCLILQTLTIRKLFQIRDRGRQRFNNLQESTMYLLDVIEKNDVDLSEFDVLALQAILQEDK